MFLKEKNDIKKFNDLKGYVLIYYLEKNYFLLEDIKYSIDNLYNLINYAIVNENSNDILYSITNDCFDSFKYIDFQSIILELKTRYNFIKLDELKKIILGIVNDLLDKNNNSTPNSLSETVIKLLHVKNQEIWYDLCCGDGDFLYNVNKYAPSSQLIGNDIDSDLVLLCKIRFYFNNIDANVFVADSITEAPILNKADCVFANYPLAVRLETNDINYFVLGENDNLNDNVKLNNNMDWFFIDRLIYSLNENGRGIAVVSNGLLSNIIDYDKRKKAIDCNLIEGVISLPGRLFSYTTIPTSLVVFNTKKLTTAIKFLDATKLIMPGRRVNELNSDEIVLQYNNFAKTVSYEKIIECNYSLSYCSYLDVNFENKIEDVFQTVFRGYQLTSEQLNKGSDAMDAYRVVSVGDLQDCSFEYDKLHKIELDDEKAKRFLIMDNDILISAKATTIKTSIAKITNEKIIASGSVIVLRCDPQKINPLFLKAFLDSETGRKMLSSVQSGTSIISLNASAIKNIKIPLPDMEKQNKIAEKYLNTLRELKETRFKLERLEEKITNIYDENISE